MKEVDKRALQEWEIFRENIRRETPVEQLSEAEFEELFARTENRGL